MLSLSAVSALHGNMPLTKHLPSRGPKAQRYYFPTPGEPFTLIWSIFTVSHAYSTRLLNCDEITMMLRAENSTWSAANRNALLCCCFIGDQKLTPRCCASNQDKSNANKKSHYKQDRHEQPKSYAVTVRCLKVLAYRSSLGICFVSRNRVRLWSCDSSGHGSDDASDICLCITINLRSILKLAKHRIFYLILSLSAQFSLPSKIPRVDAVLNIQFRCLIH